MVERIRVHVDEYLMVPGIAVPCLNSLLPGARSAVVYTTHDFTTGFLYRVYVACGSTARVPRIVVLRVVAGSGWFVDVDDAYRGIAWRELNGCESNYHGRNNSSS